MIRPLSIAILACVAACAASNGTARAASCTSVPVAGSVLYVTDRAPVDGTPLFSGERGYTKDRGALVSTGAIGTPAERSTLAPCDSNDAFLAATGKRFKGKDRQALIYIHGYYTPFVQAASDALTVAAALDFPGPVILYSWPSKVTSRLSYVNDEGNAGWSRVHFRQFLVRLQKRYPKLRISFAAHSLGARFATDGIGFIANSPCAGCFGRAVFFAPDVDTDELRSELSVAGLCKGSPNPAPTAAAPVLLYVSNRDRALRQSQHLHGHQRAGQAASEMLLCDGVDTVDVSYFKSSDRYGHSYQVDKPVLADTRAAFSGIPPTSPQRNLRRAKRDGGVYYELRPELRPAVR